MTFSTLIIGACWITVVLVWVVSGQKIKTSKADKDVIKKFITALLLSFGVLLFVPIDLLRDIKHFHLFTFNQVGIIIGVVLCIIGSTLAIWARIYMAGNWRLPRSPKQDSVLLTSGPYSMVRHPIYSGLCLAMLGSMATAGLLWFIWYFVWICYFIYSAFKEDEALSIILPNEYLAYKKKTKMLVPFLL
jgi:protein-S-isoprenylcysteine O-methyltransferase Ste14